ncbi:Cytoplasmic tRNA 2-thiolation protein [Actinidia chinensis var. chinensis]|uniref:Cytoplasmic tRNA 2-thiolation protein 2 n=1 Tax=Actinidia chinensis var. chinensis TaxID=1590841 RepID=A0A2R6Q4J8_ACTCC|nr:Cytoplasmic tRNA 2-thiolation protein [Actinidia chinensis var. chinensis]
MACGSGGSCQSGCYKDNGDEEDQHSQKKETANGVATSGNDVNNQDLCVKCKSNETIATANPAAAAIASGGDGGRFCAECFRSNLFGKFRFAVTSNAMISPSDNVLVAFSGGTSSRVALQFVHEMQCKAQKNFDASRDRSLPVFGVGVAFVDESDVYPVPSHQFDEAIEDMKLIVSNLTPPRKGFHVAPIASIYSSDSGDGHDRLKELVNAVSDVTGKDDLLLHLRMLSLQKIARQNGYTKLVLGSCTSMIACHVLTATVKGQGYSLAADIQYVDARWEIPVVLPLRDCLKQELDMLCCLDSLNVVKVLHNPHSGINGLVSSFVKLLQEENPSRECTIVRTAGKLTPFHFNRIPETDDHAHLASRRRQKKFNLKPNESLPPESFCPICNSPLSKSDLLSLNDVENGHSSAETFGAKCCLSCQFQILPKEPSSMEDFYLLLPQPIVARAKDGNHCNQRWLREQIQDCLLSDSEDGT